MKTCHVKIKIENIGDRKVKVRIGVGKGERKGSGKG